MIKRLVWSTPLFAAFLIACGTSEVAHADEVAEETTAADRAEDPPPPPGGHREPPPEAVAACKDKAEDAACTVTLRERTLEGACKRGPDGKGPLACAPPGPPPPPPGGERPGPPPEAVDACKGRAEAEACTVTFRERTIEGVCRKEPDGTGALACAPNGPPPGPPPQLGPSGDPRVRDPLLELLFLLPDLSLLATQANVEPREDRPSHAETHDGAGQREPDRQRDVLQQIGAIGGRPRLARRHPRQRPRVFRQHAEGARRPVFSVLGAGAAGQGEGVHRSSGLCFPPPDSPGSTKNLTDDRPSPSGAPGSGAAPGSKSIAATKATS